MLGGIRCGNCRYVDECTPDAKVKNGENCEKYLIEDTSIFSGRNWV